MEHVWLSGNLSELPFPCLLFRLWKNRLSGTLEIETESGITVDFKNGDICVPDQRFTEGDGMFQLKEQFAGEIPEIERAESLLVVPNPDERQRALAVVSGDMMGQG